MSQKYDFQGIQKAGRAVINSALLATSWGAWIIKSPFNTLLNYLEDLAINWLTNQGLIIINIGAIYVNGVLDQKAFDQAFDEAINKAKVPGLSDADKKKIDNQVIEAVRKFGRIGNAT